jgi:hypothetical protein
MQPTLRRLRLLGTRLAQIRAPLQRGDWNSGVCPVCQRPTLFIATGTWLRDQYVCLFCWSIPRQRALLHVLNTAFPNWPTLQIHESSPSGAASRRLQRSCPGYLPTQFYPDTPGGSMDQGVRCENLEGQTFADASFDLVITQDVFEHVLNPEPAFAEIARTLRPGGAHVFTVPYYAEQTTCVRASAGADGVIYHLPPEYHRNPIDPDGSLVVTEWGTSLVDVIYRSSGLITTIHTLNDRSRGIAGEFRDVFISWKRHDAHEP